MKNDHFDQYAEVFNSSYDLKKEEIKLHIEKLKELDLILPPSSTFLMITNTQSGSYDYISRNFEYATRLKKTQFMKEGIPYYLQHIHPDEIQTWLKVLSDLMEYCTSEFPPEKLNRLEFQYNYRLRTYDGSYINILENQVNILSDDVGRPIVGLGHFTVFGKDQKLPIRATVKYLNDKSEYETVYHKVYGQNLLTQKISPRERDILRLISLGYDNNAIADKLSISVNTVRTHRKNLLSKTESNNATQLVVRCIREGLI